MGKWRPEGWKNPYDRTTIVECKTSGETSLGGFIASTDQQESAAFEAGADAMLKAIHEKGQFGRCIASYFSLADHGSQIYTIQVKAMSQFKDPQRVEVGHDGILAFIPSDTK